MAPAKRVRQQSAAPTAEELRQKIAVSLSEAATLLSISYPTFYRKVLPAVLTGKIKSLKIGAARRIIVSSLMAWVETEAAKEAA